VENPMNLCACESEERGHGVSAGVNATLLSGTLYSMGLAEFNARARFRLRKKPMNLCACDSDRIEKLDGPKQHLMLYVVDRMSTHTSIVHKFMICSLVKDIFIKRIY
jgi:hypothetical protein